MAGVDARERDDRVAPLVLLDCAPSTSWRVDAVAGEPDSWSESHAGQTSRVLFGFRSRGAPQPAFGHAESVSVQPLSKYGPIETLSIDARDMAKIERSARTRNGLWRTGLEPSSHRHG